MRTATRLSLRLTKLFFWLFLLMCVGVIAILVAFGYYSKDLPSTEELKNYYPKTTTRLYDSNGGILSEIAEEKRVFVPISAIPDKVKQAFVSAEDQNFYHHNGVDVTSILRAIIQNITAKVTGHGGISGGSTITQQVVKNLLLTRERTYTRKIKEAVLAVRVTQAMPKDKILEIYLNEIFLGNRSYGVVEAAYNYFNKSIDELTIEDAAFLAAMPKAPSNFDPHKNYDRAIERRNYVLDRMHHDGYINKQQWEESKAKPIALAQGHEKEIITNSFAEEVRRFLIEKYGDDQVYGGGMTVKTTLDPKLQSFAEQALFRGITKYDRDHGWRGRIGKIKDLNLWKENLVAIKDPDSLGLYKLAVILKVTPKEAEIGLKSGKTATLSLENCKWAKLNYSNQRVGLAPTNMKDIGVVGDVIAVSENKNDKGALTYALEQIPDVNGAMIVMDPHSGRILAMVGGYPYGASDFNRATQAKRQPGSSFKPFVYLTALLNGFLPTTIVNDGPIVVPQGPGMPNWAPKNYGHDFLGPITLETALAKSRNNVTVLVSLMLGVDKVQEMAKKMGILDDPQPYYSMVLGAQETTLLRLITAYSIIDNFGKKVQPVMIDRIQDRTGKTIFRGDKRECAGCTGDNIATDLPQIVDKSEQLIEPAATYQIITMLQQVIQRGTSTRAKILARPLAGKTGTTNDSFDTWFMGVTPDVIVGTFVGFDKPRTLGKDSTGASVPLPIFIDFMQHAYPVASQKPFPIPPGVRFQRIDTTTGQPPLDGANPANVKMVVINPKAPTTIQYSEEYRNRFAGAPANPETPSTPGAAVPEGEGGNTGNGSVDSGLY